MIGDVRCNKRGGEFWDNGYEKRVFLRLFRREKFINALDSRGNKTFSMVPRDKLWENLINV